MNPLDFVVWRRGLDPEAETCLHALQHLLHLDVTAVDRALLWRFFVPASLSRSATCVRLEEAASRSGRYVNPNRDDCSWTRGPRPYPRIASPGGSVVEVWVCDADGRDPVAFEYFRNKAVPELEDLRTGTLWRLALPEPDPVRARELGLRITTTHSRRQGLLMNPNGQTAEILHVVAGPSAGEAA